MTKVSSHELSRLGDARKLTLEAVESAERSKLKEAGAGFYAVSGWREELFGNEAKATRASAELQKILDHPGIVLNQPIAALAHLQLERAYALQAQASQGADADAARAKARAAYQDFLTLWQHADPDIPVLKQAQSEYAKLE
jgi:hypothetical protein